MTDGAPSFWGSGCGGQFDLRGRWCVKLAKIAKLVSMGATTLGLLLPLALALSEVSSAGAVASEGPIDALRAEAALDALLLNFWSAEQHYLLRCAGNASDVDSGGDATCSQLGPGPRPPPPPPPFPSLQCDHKTDCCAGLPEKEREQCATEDGCKARHCCWDDSHGPKNFCSPPSPPPSPSPPEPKLTGYWNYQEALHAVSLGAAMHPLKYSGWVKRLVDSQFTQGSGWKVDYYDDMNWAVLALLTAHDADIDGAQGYLDQARTVFGYVSAAWDDSVCGGGVWWDKQHTQKATASNAGSALSAALLFSATGNRRYLDFGEKVYTFWNATMTDPQTGAVTDHYITNGPPPGPPSPPPVHHNCSHTEDCCGDLPRGSPAYNECATPTGCDKRGCCWDQNSPPHNWCSGKPTASNIWVHAGSRRRRRSVESGDIELGLGSCAENHDMWTYNEGLMLGAATALAAATAKSDNSSSGSAALRLRYAADAMRFARHLVSSQTENDEGRVLVDSCDWGRTPCHDCSQFKGIAYRELARWLGSPLATSQHAAVSSTSAFGSGTEGKGKGGGGSAAQTELVEAVTKLLDDSAAIVWEGRQEGTSVSRPVSVSLLASA